MSLSWLDRLTLFIHPQRVVFERQPWRGAASRLQADVAPAASGEADWQPALAAAEALLKADGKRGATLQVVVADHFASYAVLPWSPEVIGKTARLNMARALFRHTLGERADGLGVALDRPAFGQNGLAAAIDKNLLAGLRALAKWRRIRLSSLQPRLIAEMSAHHKQLDDGWFACLDQGWLALAGVRDGEIASLRNHRASTADPAVLSGELAGLLAAEASTVNGKKVLISKIAVDAPKLPAGWEVSVVPAIMGGAHA